MKIISNKQKEIRRKLNKVYSQISYERGITARDVEEQKEMYL